MTHVVRRGESLGSIAKKYHTTVADLKRLNHLRKTMIFPGQEILIRRAATGAPRRASSKGHNARDLGSARLGDRTTNGEGEGSRRCGGVPCVSLSSAARVVEPTGRGVGQTHVVQRGESLTVIAKRYHTTVAALKELNGMTGDGIQAGQRLRVKG
jgi:LysM repeat protein